MTTVRKTIIVTDKQDAWIKAQIAKGGYTNDSELIRELIRKEQGKQADAGLSDERKAEIAQLMKKHDETLQKLAQGKITKEEAGQYLKDHADPVS